MGITSKDQEETCVFACIMKAYSDATIKSIEISEKVEICMGQEAEVEIEYNNLESFKYYCKINDIYIDDFVYSDKVICKIQLKDESMKRLVEDFETKKINLINLKFLSKKLINKSILK